MPSFPAMANAARVGADVELRLGIHRDGTVGSVTAVSGTAHPANGGFAKWGLTEFTRVAIESATQSLFDCQGCVLPVTFYSLVYSFEPGPQLRGDCPSVDPINPLWRQPSSQQRVALDGSHVIVTGPRMPVCPGPDDIFIETRSARCLYLWKCRKAPAPPENHH